MRGTSVIFLASWYLHNLYPLSLFLSHVLVVNDFILPSLPPLANTHTHTIQANKDPTWCSQNYLSQRALTHATSVRSQLGALLQKAGVNTSLSCAPEKGPFLKCLTAGDITLIERSFDMLMWSCLCSTLSYFILLCFMILRHVFGVISKKWLITLICLFRQVLRQVLGV